MKQSKLSCLLLALVLCFFSNLLFAQRPNDALVISKPGMRQPYTLAPNQEIKVHLNDLTIGHHYEAMLSTNSKSENPFVWIKPEHGDAQRSAANIYRFEARATATEISCTNRFNKPRETTISLVDLDVKNEAQQAKSNLAVLQANYGSSPENLVKTYLFGNSCNIVSNVTFNGQFQSAGYFTGGATNIGLDQGFMLATGDVHVVQGPNNRENASLGWGIAGFDPDLSSLGSGPMYDIATMEFDVTVNSSQLAFQYVFGSEEYCEYVGSQFNDRFGIFVSGPGINGVKNIATVAPQNDPVSINSINHQLNANLYVNNAVDNLCGQNTPPAAPAECQFDGWTKPLTASLQVTPCATYHVKIAICDVSDGIWDSGVFFRTGGTGTQPTVYTDVMYANGQSGIYEGCQPAKLRFSRVGTNLSAPLNVQFTLGGTATAGVDYTALSSPVVIPAGQSFVEIPMNAFADAIQENTETIVLSVLNGCSCGGSLTININESPALTVNLQDTAACFTNGGIVLAPVVTGGAAPFTYLWSNGSTDSQIFIGQTGIYIHTVTVTDACGNSQSDDAVVTSNPYFTGTQYIQFCVGDSVNVFGVWYFDSSTFTVNGTGTNGQCDTSITYVLEEVSTFTINNTITLCASQFFVLNGQSYFAPDTVSQIHPGLNGACDTLVQYFLNLAPSILRSKTLSFCQGTSVTINGTIYTTSGTVLDTLSGTNGACDTIVTYNLLVLPPIAQSQTVQLCPGETFQINGISYTAPNVIQQTIPGTNGQCDKVITWYLTLKTYFPSTVQVQCPPSQTVNIDLGATLPIINYIAPTATSNCPCPGIGVQQTSGLGSGIPYPIGVTTNCFTAKDLCGSTATCCFTVTVSEESPCDSKTAGCIKWELFPIEEDGELNTHYKIKVTNNCTSKLVWADFQVPNGIEAIEPAGNSLYTAPSGRKYQVTNPNFSPFYSVRFAASQGSILNGGSDIFEYALPPQADVTFILVMVRISPSTYYAAHLNTFGCGNNNSNSSEDRSEIEATMAAKLFPNPSEGLLFVDLPANKEGDAPVRVLDSRGVQVYKTSISTGVGPQAVVLPETLPDGMYFFEIPSADGKTEVVRFMLER
jgi:hypothetical protein